MSKGVFFNLSSNHLQKWIWSEKSTGDTVCIGSFECESEDINNCFVNSRLYVKLTSQQLSAFSSFNYQPQ